MSVLILGTPRSGTTWLGEMLGATPGARYVHEPDNELIHVEAAYAKRRLGRFPMLTGEDSARAYARLWRRAFDGARPAFDTRLDALHRRIHQGRLAPLTSLPLGWIAQRVRSDDDARMPVVKSVHAALCAEWVADRSGATHVVVLTREPLNVIASMFEMRMPDADRGLDADPRLKPAVPLPTRLHRVAWQFGTLQSALVSAAQRNPGWTVVSHESLLEDPMSRIPELASALALEWPDEATERLEASNATGSGYRTTRQWSQLDQRWRRALTDEDAEVVRLVLRDSVAEPRD